MTKLRYLKGYPEHILAQVEPMIANGKLAEWVKNKYPTMHDITSEKALFD